MIVKRTNQRVEPLHILGIVDYRVFIHNFGMSKNWQTIGVRITDTEKNRLERIAKRFGISRHALMRWLILNGLSRIESGELDLSSHVEKRNILIDPD